jgi:glucose/arabinose dehydrogenase
MRYFLLFLLVFLLAGCSETSQYTADPDNGGLILPDGFAALVVADSLGPGRHLVVAENGDIYLALRRLKDGHGAVALRDTTGDGKADVIRYFGSVAGTGIKLHKGYLYFGSDTAIVRYPFKEAGDLVPEETYEIIAKGFPNERQHAAKPFEFDGEGNMYVTVGAPSNACMAEMRTKGSPGLDPCPILEWAGGIWQLKEDLLNQDYLEDGHRYSTGIRHAVAISWNDQVDRLYAVQHGRDQLHQFFPELYSEKESAELPSEEFLLLTDGADFGWPYCYYNHLEGKKVLAPEYGGDKVATGRCESKTDPIMGFPGHVAPNDLVFYTHKQFPDEFRGSAFIAFHGSWNRAPLPQEGYYIVNVPFEGELPSGEWSVFADGFSGLEEVENPRDAIHRPTGLAVGPDGALYVSDSRQGTIWKIFYNEK